MKAISVRAPWWWFILHAGKDIENRDWPTKFRGTVYVHSSSWWKPRDVAVDLTAGLECWNKPDVTWMSEWDTMRSLGGCIVGKVDIVDCVSESDSPWFFGKYGFVLANPVAFVKPVPHKGALGFFDVAPPEPK